MDGCESEIMESSQREMKYKSKKSRKIFLDLDLIFWKESWMLRF